MIFNRSNVLVLALGLLAVLSPRPADAALKRAGGRKTRSEDPAERRRLLEEREEMFAEDNPYSAIADQEHRRAHSGSGHSGYGGALYHSYSGSGTGKGSGGKGKGSGGCGYPGERCCADPSHRCLPGYGCKFPGMTPNEVTDYTCQPCGSDGQPCCNIGCGDDSCESECLPGNTCNLFKNECEGCGANKDDPCCPGDVCTGAGLACNTVSGKCDECGDEDEVCCSGDKCSGDSDQVLTCNTDANKCEECGNLDQQCCPNDVCTGDGLACNTVSEKCEECGDKDEVCCSGDQCSGTSTQVLTCNTDANKCEECGNLDQQCCPNDVCNSGTTDGDLACNTVTGTCQICGTAIGQICCPGNKCPNSSTDDRLSCNAATLPPSCRECGEPGGPCCPKEDGYEFECDTDGKFDCIGGICPDATPGQGGDPAGCILGNGSGPARQFDPIRGCNQNTGGTDDDRNANNDLCCKGQCLQGPGDPGVSGFLWCVK